MALLVGFGYNIYILSYRGKVAVSRCKFTPVSLYLKVFHKGFSKVTLSAFCVTKHYKGVFPPSRSEVKK